MWGCSEGNDLQFGRLDLYRQEMLQQTSLFNVLHEHELFVLLLRLKKAAASSSVGSSVVEPDPPSSQLVERCGLH